MAKYLLGLGNPAMTDDSIGLRLAEHFFENIPNNFEAADLAHDSMRILFYCEPSTTQIIIVDCVKMGLSPGEMRVFSQGDVVSNKPLANFSTHEGDVLQTLQLGKELGYAIPPICIVGIEPDTVSFGTELSPLLSGLFHKYVVELTKLMQSY